jgi:hypothetical protein
MTDHDFVYRWIAVVKIFLRKTHSNIATTVATAAVVAMLGKEQK